MVNYHVDAFVPSAPGCGKHDGGWDTKRCGEFSAFLNRYASEGWKLHSCEYRSVRVNSNCGPNSGSWLVCVFEKGQ